MNKQEITKQYGIILLCLAIVSMLIMFATPFITAFKMDLGIIGGSETGMDYLIGWMDLESDDDTSSDDDLWSEELSDITLIEENSEKWIMRGLVLMLLGMPIYFAVKAFSAYSDSDKNVLVYRMMYSIRMGLGANAVYYIFCMYIILKGHDWDIASVISGDVMVTTKTFVPLFFQIAIFIGSLLIYKHWEKAVAGQAKPLFYSGFSSAPQGSAASVNVSNNVRSESETIELLTKYKELWDSGVITEEEFKAKKEELLGTKTRQAHQSNATVNIDYSDTRSESGETHEDIVAHCENCNYPLTANQEVCPHCGTRAIQREKTYSMKYYNFLVKFSLFAGAILNTITALLYFTGALYDGYADEVYEALPELKTLDIVYGMLLVGMSIMGLVTRSALNWNKRKGPILLCACYILGATVSAVYTVLATVILEEMLFDAYVVLSLLSSVAMVFINHSYFKKRKELFIY